MQTNGRARRCGLGLAAVASLLTATAHAEVLVMKPVGQNGVTAQVVGGQKLDGANWPATMTFWIPAGMCTSTVVGPRAVLTAAHCVDDGADARIDVGGQSFALSCQRHPKYNAVYLSNDLALCLASADIELNDTYERLSLSSTIVRNGGRLFLIGYGCTSVGGPASPAMLYGGLSTVFQLPNVTEPHVRTNRSNGGVMICPGDSGGAAYSLTNSANPDGNRLVIGVNSAYDPGPQVSYIAPLSLLDNAAFVRDWSLVNKAPICGIDDAAPNCR